MQGELVDRHTLPRVFTVPAWPLAWRLACVVLGLGCGLLAGIVLQAGIIPGATGYAASRLERAYLLVLGPLILAVALQLLWGVLLRWELHTVTCTPRALIVASRQFLTRRTRRRRVPWSAITALAVTTETPGPLLLPAPALSQPRLRAWAGHTVVLDCTPDAVAEFDDLLVACQARVPLTPDFEGLDAPVELEGQQARRIDPDNPLAQVHDLESAHHFVLAHYPPHPSPREQAVALAFAVLVEHVRYTLQDAVTGRAPRPAALDRFLDEQSPVELIAALRASPRSWVRRSLKRLRKEVHTEDNLEALFLEIAARYGGRWDATPAAQVQGSGAAGGARERRSPATSEATTHELGGGA